MSAPGPGGGLVDTDGATLRTVWAPMGAGLHVHRRGSCDTVADLPVHTHDGQAPHIHDADGFPAPAPAPPVDEDAGCPPILAAQGHEWEAEVSYGAAGGVHLAYGADLVDLVREVDARHNLHAGVQVVLSHVQVDHRAPDRAHTLDTLPGLSQAARAVILAAVREGAGLWRLPRYVDLDVLAELARHRLLRSVSQEGAETEHYLTERGTTRRGEVLRRLREDVAALDRRAGARDGVMDPGVDDPAPGGFTVPIGPGVDLPLTRGQYAAIDGARDELLSDGTRAVLVPADTPESVIGGLVALVLAELVVAAVPAATVGPRYRLTSAGRSAHYRMRQTSGGDRPPPATGG